MIPYTRYLLLLLMLLSHISSLFTSCAKNWMKRSFFPALSPSKSIRSQMCRETFQTDTVLPPTSFLLTLFVIFTTTYLKFVTLLFRTDLTESVCCDSLNWEFLCVCRIELKCSILRFPLLTSKTSFQITATQIDNFNTWIYSVSTSIVFAVCSYFCVRVFDCFRWQIIR